MIELSYITEHLLKTLTEEPARAIKALEYACALTLLIAMVSDSIMRRRRPVRQSSPFQNKIGRR